MIDPARPRSRFSSPDLLRPLRRAILVAASTWAFTAWASSPLKPTSEKWDAAIAAFQSEDAKAAPPADGILFVGSSSIRLWKTLAQDFPDLPVYNRGFGGSQIIDSVFYADRIVLPYKPKTIVFYAGTNDVASGKSPETVLEDFQLFVEKVRQQLPDTKIYYISFAPNPRRWAMVDKMKETNRLFKDYIAGQKNIVYVDVFDAMLGPDGQPLPDIYLADKLHMNAKGYEIWTGILRPYLKGEKG